MSDRFDQNLVNHQTTLWIAELVEGAMLDPDENSM